jgi:hypothetical protein
MTRHGKRLRRTNGGQRRQRRRVPKWPQVRLTPPFIISTQYATTLTSLILARTLSSRKYVFIISNHTGRTLTTYHRVTELNRQKKRAVPDNQRASTSQIKSNRRSNLKWRRCPKVRPLDTTSYTVLLTRCYFAVQRHGGTTGKLCLLLYLC